jgi:CheY-like chemotaxis protein
MEFGRGIPRPADSASASPLAGTTVLVVEDHPDSREMLRDLLESQGASVAVAVNGQDGLDALKRMSALTLVLCDVRMPGMDGLEFTRRLREDARWHRVPVVAVTAYGADRDYLATLQAGFDAHLVKPVDLSALLAVVSRVRPRPLRGSARRRSTSA